jgi:hypothetical protein
MSYTSSSPFASMVCIGTALPLNTGTSIEHLVAESIEVVKYFEITQLEGPPYEKGKI